LKKEWQGSSLVQKNGKFILASLLKDDITIKEGRAVANIVNKEEKEKIRKWINELNTKNLFLKVRGNDSWTLRAELIDSSINKFPGYVVNDFVKIKNEFLEKGYNGVIQLINNSYWKYKVEKVKDDVLIFLDKYIKIKLYREQNDEFQAVISNVFEFAKNNLYFNYRYAYYHTPFYSKNIKVSKIKTRYRKYIGLDRMLAIIERIEKIKAYTDFYWEIKDNTFKAYIAEAFLQKSGIFFKKKYYIEVFEIEAVEIFTKNLNLNISNINTPFEILKIAEKINAEILELPHTNKMNIEKIIKNTLENTDFEATVIYNDVFNKKVYVLIILNDFLSLLFDFYMPFIVFVINRRSKLYTELKNSKIGDKVGDILSKEKNFLNYVWKFLYCRFP